MRDVTLRDRALTEEEIVLLASDCNPLLVAPESLVFYQRIVPWHHCAVTDTRVFLDGREVT